MSLKGMATKKTRRPSADALWETRQEQILEAAAKLFAKHGYAQTDTQLLADELGVGKGTLYRYFPSKETLFLAAADRVMHQMRLEIDTSIEGIADPLDQIEVAIRAYLAFCAEHPEFIELLIQERAQFKDRKTPTYFEHREANVGRWLDLYRSLIADGRIRNMPVERILGVLSDLLYGTMITNYFIGRQKPIEEQARDILDVVYNGILTEREREARGRVK